MIGNDVVDLSLAKIETNWQRKGFLEKIFTKNEQRLIKNSISPEITVWNLWSRKEAVYKIWNRESGLRKFNPIKFECFNIDSLTSEVYYESNIYFTNTKITNQYIYSVAVKDVNDFFKIKKIDRTIIFEKLNNIPFYINLQNEKKPISKTHHGRFEFVIGL
jgi:phosphopantetheinyl transferase (holo-ACP synthase)